jgi:membrane peptidoglycan carboxypeptidase
LIKNTYLTSARTPQRKLKEMTYAILLEQHFSKDQILERYLNEVYYGQQSYGVADAAKTYFGKDLSQLTLGESTMLAGLPSAPTLYSPLGSNPQLSKQRQHYVLERMTKLGYITKPQEQAAQAEQLTYTKSETVLHAPHFVFQVKQALAQYYGANEVDQGGLKVYTTLDMNKQTIAEEEVRKGVDSVRGFGATNGAMVVEDPKTGEVLAEVGSKDFNDDAISGKVNVATAQRQPGSSFKPFVYLTALKEGKAANTVLHDKPTTFYNTFTPHNYDGSYHGNVTLRYAIGNSLNVPSVELLDQVGSAPTIQTAHDLGITTLNEPDRYGLSLVLGGGEVKLTDMVASFGVLANKGQAPGQATVMKIVGPGEKTIYERHPATRQAVDPGQAFIISDILGDSKARTIGFGANNPLNFPRPAAVKTGTTNDYRDNWTVGYTPNLVVGVWVGNSDNSPMQGISGIQGAAPIWNSTMQRLLSGVPVEQFQAPDNVVRGCACVRALGGSVSEYFIKGTQGANSNAVAPGAEGAAGTESDVPQGSEGSGSYYTIDRNGRRHYYNP